MHRHLLMSVLIELSFGPLVWFAHFSTLYLAATVFCLDRWRGARLLGWPALDISIAILTLVAAGLIVLALSLWRRRPRQVEPQLLPPRFRDVVPPLLAGLSLIAIFWQASVAVLVPAC